MTLLQLDFYQIKSPPPPLHPRQYPQSLRQPKTPPRHILVNLQTPQNRALIECHSMSNPGLLREKELADKKNIQCSFIEVSSDDLA